MPRIYCEYRREIDGALFAVGQESIDLACVRVVVYPFSVDKVEVEVALDAKLRALKRSVPLIENAGSVSAAFRGFADLEEDAPYALELPPSIRRIGSVLTDRNPHALLWKAIPSHRAKPSPTSPHRCQINFTKKSDDPRGNFEKKEGLKEMLAGRRLSTALSSERRIRPHRLDR